MDSNHRTPKRTDLQSVAVGHLATCPTQSQRRDSNPRPADYKSAALPTELLWHFYDAVKKLIDKTLKNFPINGYAIFFGKAKVNEFVKSKNFEKEIFQGSILNKKTSRRRFCKSLSNLFFFFSFHLVYQRIESAVERFLK